MRGREKFQRFKLLIQFLFIVVSIFPKKLRLIAFQWCRMIQGKVGLVIRYVLLKSLSKKVGENVAIHPGVYIFNVENLLIGSNVSIHPMCYIEAYGGIDIGNDVSIAHSVTILSVNHVFSDINIPIKDQGIKSELTKIEDNVWIGAKASILPGVVINTGSIIATGAVVTKSVNQNTIVGGVPASLIKTRK